MASQGAPQRPGRGGARASHLLVDLVQQVQRELLHIELAQLQQALMKAWGLSELLVRISDDAHADSAQVRNVTLAVRLARHTARGWDNPAVADDVNDVAALLNLSPVPTLHLLHEIDEPD